MSDIVIVGGGFAGLEVARCLAKKRAFLRDRRIILIDAKRTSDFLPLLPDVAGGCIRKENVIFDLADYLDRLRVSFEWGEVIRINTETKEIFLKSGNILGYEYLILACGSQTHFFGMDDVRHKALKLDSADDAATLFNAVATYPEKKILIMGGGYTGIEIASHLAVFFRRKKFKGYSVNIIEKGSDILGLLPLWIKDACRINLCRLRVNLYPDCFLREVTDCKVKLSNGLEFEDYLLVWAAGVATHSFVRDLKFEKDAQGRLFVDAHVMFDGSCFAVGDVAAFRQKGRALRMSVWFALSEARIAASNVLRMIAQKKTMIKYRPFDPGFLVPMAGKRAYGKFFIFNMKGLAGWALHCFMCLLHSLSIKNKIGIFYDYFLKRGW